MTPYLEAYAAERRERLDRLRRRSPDALPPRTKPPMRVIRLDRKGRQLTPSKPAIPLRDVLRVASALPGPLIPRAARVSHAQVEDIERITAAAFGITRREMRQRSRMVHIARPRMVAMYVTRELLGISTPRIGRLFGGYDHTTVINANRKVERRMAANPDYAAKVGGIIAAVKEMDHVQA